MQKNDSKTKLEELVLLAVALRNGDGYGATILHPDGWISSGNSALAQIRSRKCQATFTRCSKSGSAGMVLSVQNYFTSSMLLAFPFRTGLETRKTGLLTTAQIKY